MKQPKRRIYANFPEEVYAEIVKISRHRKWSMSETVYHLAQYSLDRSEFYVPEPFSIEEFNRRIDRIKQAGVTSS